MYVLTYFTAPVATTTLAGASAWFVPLWDEFYPFAVIAIGVILVFGALAWLINMFASAMHHNK